MPESTIDSKNAPSSDSEKNFVNTDEASSIPTFGTMRPGVSFKNAVALNAPKSIKYASHNIFFFE